MYLDHWILQWDYRDTVIAQHLSWFVLSFQIFWKQPQLTIIKKCGFCHFVNNKWSIFNWYHITVIIKRLFKKIEMNIRCHEIAASSQQMWWIGIKIKLNKSNGFFFWQNHRAKHSEKALASDFIGHLIFEGR